MKWLAALLITITALVGSHGDALACDCPLPPPPEQAYASAALVVLVRIDPTSVASTEAKVKQQRNELVTLPVLRSFKGGFEKPMIGIKIEANDCTYLPSTPGEHILYLRQLPVGYTTSICSRSTLASTPDGKAEIAALERIMKAAPASPAPDAGAGAAPTSASTTASSSTPSAASSTPPSSAPPKGGCAGCSTVPSTTTIDASFVALAVLGATAFRLSRRSRRESDSVARR